MLKSEIIKKVEKEFAEKQSKVNSAKRNAFAENMRNPEFAKLEGEIRNLNIQIAKKESENEDVTALNKSLEELTNKQKQIEKPYLVNYECEKCKDKGITNGHYCSCFNKRVNELIVAESGVSIETLRDICSAVKVPVVAIGGITKRNLPKLSGTGFDGVALVSAIFAADDIENECKELLEISRKAVYGC